MSPAVIYRCKSCGEKTSVMGAHIQKEKLCARCYVINYDRIKAREQKKRIIKSPTILNPLKRLHSIHCKNCNKETVFDTGSVRKGNVLKCPKCRSILAKLVEERFLMVTGIGLITKSKLNKGGRDHNG